MREQFVEAVGYWCRFCAVPWEVRIVAPPGGCLHSHCRKCGRSYYEAVTTSEQPREAVPIQAVDAQR